jgi:hypothetical protein
MNFLLTFTFIVFGWALPPVVIADDNEPQNQKVQTVDGQTIIRLDEQAQQLSGIQTTTLKPSTHREEFIAYGKAISIQPLIELRHRYLIALAERQRTLAKFNLTEQQLKRQQDLYQQGISAKRNLQDSQAQMQTDKSQLDSLHYQRQNLVDEALLNWGKILSNWALTTEQDKLNSFLMGQKTLLQITIPTSHQLAANSQTIYVEPSGNLDKAQQAQLIGLAPQSDVNSQGTRYFFQTPGNKITAGMSVTAWLPSETRQQTGVIFPKSALIWSMDQAFVYLKMDGDKFTRRAVNNYATTNTGYFISHTLKPGEQVVTIGAEMLLSEELRGQLSNDDD